MRQTAQILAERYANALLELAVEHNLADVLGDQLAQLAATCYPVTNGKPEPRAANFWRSPKISAEDKRDLLQDFLEKLNAHTLVRNLANLLLERGRIEILPDLVAAYRAGVQQLHKIVEAHAVSAFALNADTQERLRLGLEKLSGRSVQLQLAVDPALLGGVRVRLGNLVIDGSVLGRLQTIRRDFAK